MHESGERGGMKVAKNSLNWAQGGTLCVPPAASSDHVLETGWGPEEQAGSGMEPRAGWWLPGRKWRWKSSKGARPSRPAPRLGAPDGLRSSSCPSQEQDIALQPSLSTLTERPQGAEALSENPHGPEIFAR